MPRTLGTDFPSSARIGSSPARKATGFGAFQSSSAGSSLSYLAEPPDFSSLSDANVVVSFKNLLKKDTTTKTKALEELVARVQAQPHEQDGGAEEAILDVWVQLYPRTSIDNGRRVRELSHNLQFELMKSARKRMEKRIPKIVGSWLAGLYDKDKAVARAASDGLSSFLNTPDKIVLFWKRCQSQILIFATDAIQETKDTLSDERSTTVDDAEAKYYRVINISLCLVIGLLQKLDRDDLEKEAEAYDSFFSEDKVWKSATLGDPSVRKAACQLLWICLNLRLDALESQVAKLKKTFIVEGLKSNQSGSSVEYVRVLTRLTQKFPAIWTSSSDKKTPVSRLCSFLERGSQGSAASFWEHMEQLLLTIPQESLSVERVPEVTKSWRLGIISREEPRTNLPSAWACYIRSARHLIRLLPSGDAKTQYLNQHIYPLAAQYLHPVPENSAWGIPEAAGLAVLTDAFALSTDSHSEELLLATSEEWNRLSQDFCTRISGSLPEVSKDYQQSQTAISAEGHRWFMLVGHIQAQLSLTHPKAAGLLTSSSLPIISRSIDLLRNRNFKPFGAADVLHQASQNASQIWECDDVAREMEPFLLDEGGSRMATIIESNSAPSLINCVAAMNIQRGQKDVYPRIWNTWMGSMLRLQEVPQAQIGIKGLLSQPAAVDLARDHHDLQDFIASKAQQFLAEGSGSFDILEAAISHSVVAEPTMKNMAESALRSLRDASHDASNALQLLELIVSVKPDLLSQDEDTRMAFVTSLLRLTELDVPEVASKAASLRALVENNPDERPAVISIIQKHLENAGPQALSEHTLCEQAVQALRTGTVSAEDLMPDTEKWMNQLRIFFADSINPSLSITSNLEGAQFLLGPSQSAVKPRVSRDRDGSSVAARMAMYTIRMAMEDGVMESLPRALRIEILCLLSISAQLAGDQVTLGDTGKLWATMAHERSVHAAVYLVDSPSLSLDLLTQEVEGWGKGTGDESPSQIEELLSAMVQRSRELTPLGLDSARALSGIVEYLVSIQALSGEETLATFDVLKATPATALGAVALLRGFGDSLRSSKLVNTFCNRLVSDIARPESDSEAAALLTLVLFNACAAVYEAGQLPVANNRLVFAARQIATSIEDPVGLTPEFSTEICRALRNLLPNIRDVYGPHWERAIAFCTSLWTKACSDESETAISYLHASLKLMATLESIEEPNDDLEDALKESAETRSLGLLELLKRPRGRMTEPLGIVDGILCRKVVKIPLKHIDDLSELYGLVASESTDIQTAAFGILHRAIPASQEQLSVDVLLDKKVARLPDELLSLLLDAPTLEKYADDLEQFPDPIRSYLLSWLLVFDAFGTASAKVREDYTEHLKVENHVGPLLDFMFDVLGHSAAHALNLDKEGLAEQITTYDINVGDAEPPERNLHWLLVHLCYLVLKFTPGLLKAWYIECRSKQTKIALETWTTKYFSPIIISEVLAEVSAWSTTQSSAAKDDDDDKELIVKVNPQGREIKAGYEVDESLASIAIRVPAGYPLENVSVVSLNRVAVSEKKWQSWLMTTQGVITFSNGSIIDGLTTFRRNIVGALKGQVECAICYSLISTDRKMPDKKCSTCKNLFHRTCLYKWFQSSNQNTCPLCRNPIDYLGSDVKSRRGL